MAFRKFGGLNYATNNNIVHNTYSNTKNLTITNQVGVPNSNLSVQSNLDMSGNSLFEIGEAHFETGFITSGSGALTFDNSTSISSGIDFNAGAGIQLRGMDFNNAAGTTFRFNTTDGGTISLHNQTVSVVTGDINLTAPTDQTIFIDPLLTVPKITTRPGTDLFVSTGSPDGNIRIDRDVDIVGNIIHTGESLFEGNVGIIGTLGVTGTSLFDGEVGVTGLFGVTGSSTFDGSVGVTGLFGVTGSSTFNGESTFNGSIIFNGSIGVTDALGATGGFGVTGASIFNGSVGITGMFGVTGTSTFDGSVSVRGPFDVTGLSTFNDRVDFVDYVPTCSIGPSGNYDLTNKQYVNSVVSAGGVTLFNNNNEWYGENLFKNKLGISAAFGVTGASTFNGSSTFIGSVGVTGQFGVTGTSTFNGSSTFIGQVGVSGPFGVTGTSTFVGQVGVTGLFGVTGTSTFVGQVGVTGQFSVVGASTFDGSVSVGGTFDVSGKATFNRGADFNGFVPACSFPPTTDYDLTNKQYVLSTVSAGGVTLLNNNNEWTGKNAFKNEVGVSGPFGVTGASTFNGSSTFIGQVGVSGPFGVTGTSTFNGSVGINPMIGDHNAEALNISNIGSSNRIGFIPNAGVAAYNNLTLVNDSLIYAAGAASDNAKLSIVPWSSTPCGIRLTNNSAFIGAGGVGALPNASISCSDGNVTLKGTLTLSDATPNVTLTQTNLSYLYGVSSEIVTVGATQTISGAKTFSGTTNLGVTNITGISTHTGDSWFTKNFFISNSALGDAPVLRLTTQGPQTFIQAGAEDAFGSSADIVFSNAYATTLWATMNNTGLTMNGTNITLGASSKIKLNDSTEIDQSELKLLDGLDSAIVTIGTSGGPNQTILGPKTFSGTASFTDTITGNTTFTNKLILGSSSSLELSNQSNKNISQAELALLYGLDSAIVTIGTSGGPNQTILGPKTFSGTTNLGVTNITGISTHTGDSWFTKNFLVSQDATGTKPIFRLASTATQTFIQAGAEDAFGSSADIVFSNAYATTLWATMNNTGLTMNGTNITLGASSKIKLNDSTEIDQSELKLLDGLDSAIVTIGTSGGPNQTILGPKTFSGTASFTGTITGNTTFTNEVTAGSFDALSDYRIKQNVINLDDTYKLDNLRPVSYYNTKLQCQDLGFLAHEVQQEIPHIVTGEKDGEKLQSINYNRLIPILVKELNEQKQENKQNKELINKLMQSNEYLMKHVNELIKKLL